MSRAAGPVHNRVLLLLVLLAALAAWSLAFLTVAPNRLVSGTGVRLADLMHGGRWALLLPATVCVAAAFAPSTRRTHATAAFAAALALAGLLTLAGDEARRQSQTLSSIARVSFGGGFWALVLLAGLAATDALQRLRLHPAAQTLAQAAVWLAPVALLASGALDQLSLMKEYTNRQDVFLGAWRGHAQIVGATLLPALLIGVPLGIAAARSARVATPVFAVLNLVQTVPSIALFGLLIAPLAWLAEALPGSGIRGIGLWPAVIALTLYALLPIVHGMAAGLRQVPAGVMEAATGMGLSPRQRFWRVELPLALPVLLAGLRVTTVQIVGLAVVAALIGAGGFGALVFQGLLSSALDLVLLGVLPVVLLAVAVDAAFKLLNAALERPAA